MITNKISSVFTSRKLFRSNMVLLLFCLPALLYMIIFNYIPIWGLQVAFKNFKMSKGIWGSTWVGFDNFTRYFNSPYFVRTFFNTLRLSFLQLIIGFPFPIILALMLNQVTDKNFKKTIQTITYAPHFISVVVLAGMIILFLNPDAGLINNIISFFGGERKQFITNSSSFQWIYVLSGIWQNAGWGMIIYLATISSIDPTLYEAAIVDGANRIQRIRYIDIPGIMPTVVIVLILRVGKLMDVGWQKALLLQNQLNLEKSELIQTYVYKVGILQGDYSYSAAIGLFNTIINLILILTVNRIAKNLKQETLI
jgi:putative aldouronate transport system permease protein